LSQRGFLGQRQQIPGPIEHRAQRRLLEVVEDHETPSAPCDGVPDLGHWIVLAQRQPEPLGHGVHDAVETSGLREIAEPDAAREISERIPAEPCDQPRLAGAADAQHRDEARPGVKAPHQFCRCGGEQDLLAMGDGHDPRGAIQRPAELIAIPKFRHAGVQAHPDSQRNRRFGN